MTQQRFTEDDVRALAKAAGYHVKREGKRGEWWASRFPDGEAKAIGSTNKAALLWLEGMMP